jgi:cytosine/uracil/thiamine/allantoin permease
MFEYLIANKIRRESVYCLILGTLVVTIPLTMNGAMGAKLYVPFPVGSRASFGFYFSRFAVCIRMVTALFWHGIAPYLPFITSLLTLLELFKRTQAPLP